MTNFYYVEFLSPLLVKAWLKSSFGRLYLKLYGRPLLLLGSNTLGTLCCDVLKKRGNILVLMTCCFVVILRDLFRSYLSIACIFLGCLLILFGPLIQEGSSLSRVFARRNLCLFH